MLHTPDDVYSTLREEKTIQWDDFDRPDPHPKAGHLGFRLVPQSPYFPQSVRHSFNGTAYNVCQRVVLLK